MRGCGRWPPPEVEKLARLHPELVSITMERGTVRRAIKAGTWAGDAAAPARAIMGALALADAAPDGYTPCPVNDISPVSHRMIRHFNRCQSFGSGMGGVVPPCPDINDANVRDVHAFNVIANEAERLRKLDRKGDA